MLCFAQLNVLFYLTYKQFNAQRTENKAGEKAEVGQWDFPICQCPGRFNMIPELQSYHFYNICYAYAAITFLFAH